MNDPNAKSARVTAAAKRHVATTLVFCGIATASLTGVATSASAQALTPQQDRISQATIHADHRTYSETQLRIKALNDGGIRVDHPALSKAQCWLDTSFHEYTRNDRGGYPQAALDQAVQLIAALESGRDPGWETPLVNGAERLRPDLWAKFETLRRHAGFRCAAQAAACGEVELVHAGNEMNDGGWRHAKPYIQIAEDLLARAEQAADACSAPAASNGAPEVETFDLAADALFNFNRGDLAGLLPQGRTALNELAQRLRSVYARVDRITLTGHTDRLGNDMYNLKLSQQRANTVKQYLQQHGVDVSIVAQGRGESLPSGKTAGCTGERATDELKQCLQPDRRVTVEIAGTRHSR